MARQNGLDVPPLCRSRPYESWWVWSCWRKCGSRVLRSLTQPNQVRGHVLKEITGLTDMTQSAFRRNRLSSSREMSDTGMTPASTRRWAWMLNCRKGLIRKQGKEEARQDACGRQRFQNGGRPLVAGAKGGRSGTCTRAGSVWLMACIACSHWTGLRPPASPNSSVLGK